MGLTGPILYRIGYNADMKAETGPRTSNASVATVAEMGTPLGVHEIASLLDVQDRTVNQWYRRKLLPDSDYPSINGFGAWDRDTILRWAGRTGRLKSAALVEEFTRKFKVPPVKARKGGRLASPEVAARHQREKAKRAAKARRKAAATAARADA